MSEVDFLPEVSLFSHMKGEDLKRIADQTRHRQFDKGQVIIKEGAHGNKLFIIISGRADEKFIRNTLGTFLPICAICKKIREDDDSWTAVEVYIRDHAETEFSHSICPECARKLYPEFYKG